MSYLTMPIEAVDPQLQPIASKVLHWHYTNMDRCILVKVNDEPTADGMPRQTTQQLGHIDMDPASGLYYIWVVRPDLPDVDGLAHPARLLRPRWLMALAQVDLIDHLKGLGRL